MRWTKVKADLVLATSAELVQKLAGYAVLAMLARHFDQSDMGRLFFALTLASMVAALTELGTGRYLVREVATRPEAALQRLGDVLALRLPLMVVGFLLLNAATAVVRPALLPVLLPASAAALLGELYYALGAFLVGRREVGLRLVTGLSGPAVLVALVLVAMARDASLTQVLGCYVVAALVPLGAGALVVRLRFGVIPHRPDRAAVWNAARGSLPFFLLSALAVLHFKVDSLLLFALASPAALAIYETGYKLFEVSRLAVRPTAMVFLPVSSALAANADWNGFARVVRRLLVWWGALGAVAAVIVAAAAGVAVSFVWGDRYVNAVPVLRILYLAVPAVYVGFVVTFAAGALRSEAAAARALGVCLAANVALNLAAIPRWGPVGAAWTTVATEYLAAVWLVMLVRGALRNRAGTPAPAAPSTAELLIDG
jgi:O-antigen/teichoic acid export membrane protein